MASHTHLTKCSPITQDILKSFRQKLTESKLKPHEDCKVWIREEGNLVVERSENLWKEHFDRRRGHYKCGFFTEPSHPFRCLGGVLSLDTNDLLYQVLSDYLEKKEKNKVDVNKKGETPTTHFVEPIVKDESRIKPASGRAATGFDKIQEKLKIQEERRVTVRAGLSYLEHVKRIEKRMGDKEEKCVNGMVLMSTSDLDLMFYPRESSAPSTPNADKDTPEKSSSESQEGVKELSDKRREVHFKAESPTLDKSLESLMKENSGMTDRLERIRKENLEFLRAVYRIMTFIRNIKPKDLKSRHPLTRLQIRDLEHERKIEKEGKPLGSLLPMLAMKNHRRSMDTTPDVSPSNIQSLIGRKKPRLFSLIGNAGILSSIGSRNSVTDRRSRMIESKEKEPRVETWEDLLRAGTKTPESENNAEVLINILTDTVTSRALKYPRRVSARDINDHDMIDDKFKPTIWQTIANEKGKSTRFQDTTKHTKVKDPASMCQGLRTEIDKLNESLKDTCMSDLRNIERDKVAAFEYKLSTFNLIKKPNVILEQLLEKMREPRDYVIRNPEMPDVVSSRWLDDLTDRMQNLMGTDDAPINAALTKLGQYSHMRAKTVSQTHARLCLIVMSLPAYDICKIATQLAIKYVLEKIFQGSPEEFYHWLNVRKLPLVIMK